MENGKNYQNFNNNFQPFFWREVKTTIRQNKKAALINFLFPNPLVFELEVSQNFESTLKSLQDQIYTLKERITILENQRNLNIFSYVSKKLPSKKKQDDI